jgi:hypothetical protein
MPARWPPRPWWARSRFLPVVAFVGHYAAHDESDNRRDLETARTVLRVAPRHAVIWAYWDVRTSLQYEHFVEGKRPDVTILDHRSSIELKSTFAVTYLDLARGAAADPALAGRPLCFIGPPYLPAITRPGFTLRRLATIRLPWGFQYLGRGPVYLVESSP